MNPTNAYNSSKNKTAAKHVQGFAQAVLKHK
jgi:hypothetical protein